MCRRVVAPAAGRRGRGGRARDGGGRGGRRLRAAVQHGRHRDFRRSKTAVAGDARRGGLGGWGSAGNVYWASAGNIDWASAGNIDWDHTTNPVDAVFYGFLPAVARLT